MAGTWRESTSYVWITSRVPMPVKKTNQGALHAAAATNSDRTIRVYTNGSKELGKIVCQSRAWRLHLISAYM
jgi:hypothetical protein